jgi:acyl-[acyl carrier protein]--UDP-N-acetylglucosamine O-acyltransferase
VPTTRPLVFYNLFTFGSSANPTSGQMNTSGDLYVQFDCEVGDQLFVGSTAEVAGKLTAESSAAVGDSLDVGTYLSIGQDLSVGAPP